MKYFWALLLLSLMMSCTKEEEIPETGSIQVNFSIDLKGNTIGVFDPATVNSTFIDYRKAIRTQSITGNKEEIKELLPGNYVILVLEFEAVYLRATQVQRNKKSEIYI
jgi:hypothetical protein